MEVAKPNEMATVQSVWVKLYIGQDDQNPRVFGIHNFVGIIDQLKEKIKEKEQLACPASHLDVYPQGTAVPIPKYTEVLRLGSSPPNNTTDENPVIVVAKPQPPVQQQPPIEDPMFPYADCIYILYYKGQDDVINPVSTAFAVTDAFALTAGHTVSEKNKDGAVYVIAEPFFLAKVLGRENGVVWPEDDSPVPVKIKKFHFDHDWAVLERSDGGAFARKVPVATTPEEIPQIGASDEMTFYHCPISMFLDKDSDRLHVTPKRGSVGLIQRKSINFQNGGFDGSCGGPYVYRGKAVAIHTQSFNSALTSDMLMKHQREEGTRDNGNKRLKVADAVEMAESCASSHSSMASGLLICARASLVSYLDGTYRDA